MMYPSKNDVNYAHIKINKHMQSCIIAIHKHMHYNIQQESTLTRTSNSYQLRKMVQLMDVDSKYHKCAPTTRWMSLN